MTAAAPKASHGNLLSSHFNSAPHCHCWEAADSMIICVNLRKLLQTELALANCHPWIHDPVQFCLPSGMEKTDELSHLIKAIPAWRITAQGDVQNLPTSVTFLLSASTRDISPNFMIPFVLNGFIPACPYASSCTAAWQQHAWRL